MACFQDDVTHQQPDMGLLYSREIEAISTHRIALWILVTGESMLKSSSARSLHSSRKYLLSYKWKGWWEWNFTIEAHRKDQMEWACIWGFIYVKVIVLKWKPAIVSSSSTSSCWARKGTSKGLRERHLGWWFWCLFCKVSWEETDTEEMS